MILGFGIVANVITLDASKLSKQGKFRDSELATEDLMQRKKNVTCQQFRHFLIELFVPKISFLFVASEVSFRPGIFFFGVLVPGLPAFRAFCN